MEEKSISGFYYDYGKTDDDKIVKYLEDIRIVVLTNKGANTMHGYYPLNEESISKIKRNPRKTSLSFDATETKDNPLTDLKEWKSFKYLVKSTSRFFLKPDVGEMFDQIEWRDLYSKKIKAIQYISNSYELLPDTDGEHFIMEAKLLI